MQQKVEGDKRWHDKTKQGRTDISKIIASNFFSQVLAVSPNGSTLMEKLWFAMNQKFHKKQLWWEWRFQKLLRHVVRLQKSLTVRNHTIHKQREALATQAEVIARQEDLIKQLEAMLGVHNAIEERKGGDQQ